jgi:hypothetical protein
MAARAKSSDQIATKKGRCSPTGLFHVEADRTSPDTVKKPSWRVEPVITLRKAETIEQRHAIGQMRADPEQAEDHTPAEFAPVRRMAHSPHRSRP